jgi:hypothetical protein
MASLPGIVIKIGADTVNAVQGLNRVDKALGRSMTKSEKFQATIGKVGPALGAAAVAAGAFAVKLGVDAVQAAVDDEKSVASLNRTLENLGLGFKSLEVSDFVDRLQELYGVADSDLRPAFDRLVRSTKDVGEAERAMQIAVDAAAGGQYDLLAVANALGKGYDGNTTALGKLGIGLDKATLKSGNMKLITEEMARIFGGKAATNAETMSGKLDRVTQAAGEASEQVGYELVNAMDKLAEAQGGPDGAISMIQTTGDELTTLIGLITDTSAAAAGLDFTNAAANEAGAGASGWIEGLVSQLPMVGDALVELMNARQREADAADESARAHQAETARYMALAGAARAAARGIDAATQAQEDAAVAGTWSSGTVTTRNQANEAHRRAQARARAARLAAKKKRAEERRDAVRIAKEAEAARKRAQARTGTNYGAVQTRAKRACG